MDWKERIPQTVRSLYRNHRWESCTLVLLLLAIPVYGLFFSDRGEEAIFPVQAQGEETPSQSGRKNLQDLAPAESASIHEKKPSELKTFPVHLDGAVEKPGVYFVKPGSFLQQVVQEAGGLTTDADTQRVNLAGAVEANQKYRIPKRGEEVEDGGEASAPFDAGSTQGKTGTVGTMGSGNKISLNRATEQELCTLPGIGPNTARKILTYRKEQGPFQRLEDLMKVPGIKQARYEQLLPYLTLS